MLIHPLNNAIPHNPSPRLVLVAEGPVGFVLSVADLAVGRSLPSRSDCTRELHAFLTLLPASLCLLMTVVCILVDAYSHWLQLSSNAQESVSSFAHSHALKARGAIPSRTLWLTSAGTNSGRCPCSIYLMLVPRTLWVRRCRETVL